MLGAHRTAGLQPKEIIDTSCPKVYLFESSRDATGGPAVSLRTFGWRTFEAVTITLLLLLVWGTSPPALVAQRIAKDPVGPETEAPEAASSAVRDDLATLAAEEGMTLEEATRAYSWHQPFAELVHSIRKAFPDSYADARILDDAAWIGFAEQAPPGALESIRSFERPIEVRTDLGYTESEMDDRLISSHFAALNDRNVLDAESDYNIETGEISINVKLAENVTDKESTLRQIDARITSAGPSSAESIMPITLKAVDDVQGEDHYVRGGGHLTTCTAGFAVSRYIGHDLVYGLSTAGHCGNNQDYNGRDILTYKAGHEGEWGDAQWHSSSELVRDDFTPAEGEIRDVQAVGHAVNSQSLCRYGKKTGNRCDTVYSRNHCNGSRCRLTIMDTNEADGGDSGGPWFWGHTAYGIHQGEIFWWGAKDAFTPVAYLDDAIRVEVATSPEPQPK